MSTVVDQARSTTPLVLTDTSPALFMQDGKNPATVTLPGGTNLDLSLFEVTATGVAKAESPGTVTLTLYGRATLSTTADDPGAWLPLSSAPAEPIGGPTDLPEAMFMIQATDLLVNPRTGKMQGVFKSNVASFPVAAKDLDQHPGDITDEDPLYVFAVGASFEPTVATREHKTVKEGEDPPPLCTLTLASFTLSA
jgi:hypothetical protein